MAVGIPISVVISGLFFPLGVLIYWFTSNVWTLLQQLYINEFHPHTPKDAPVVGQVGKTLAPKPGQRPVRMTKPMDADVEDEDVDAVAPPVARTAPRPGQRPNRPSGKRPPGKRPTQAKKRR